MNRAPLLCLTILLPLTLVGCNMFDGGSDDSAKNATPQEAAAGPAVKNIEILDGTIDDSMIDLTDEQDPTLNRDAENLSKDDSSAKASASDEENTDKSNAQQPTEKPKSEDSSAANAQSNAKAE